MKTIIIPTDFSSNSETALNFGMVIARQQQAQLILLHTFELPYSAGAVPFEVLQTEKEEYLKKGHQQLEQLGRKIEHAGGLKYSYIIEEGMPADCIIETARKRNADLIIMGSKGKTNVGNVLFGSVTTAVIEKADCPVLAIPEGTKISKPIKQVAYATNFLSSDLSAINTLVKVAVPMDASITILHVDGDEDHPENAVKKMNEYMNRLTKAFGFNRFSFEILNGDDVESELRKYVSDGKTDMLVVSTRYRNFFGRLLGESVTKQLAGKLTVPMIAFHYHKETPLKVF